jgi:hypothetical protein
MTEYDITINPRNAAYKIFDQGPEKYPGDQYCGIVHIYMCIIYYRVQSLQYYISLVFLKKYLQNCKRNLLFIVFSIAVIVSSKCRIKWFGRN